MNIIVRTDFTESIAFLEPPNYQTRQDLKKAGFRYTGMYWVRTHGTTSTLSPEQLNYVLNPEKVFGEPA